MSKRYPGGVIRQTPDTPTQASATGVWNMTDVTQAQQTNNWPVANVPNPMSRSLRFRSSATAYMNRTPSVAGNKKTWTYSAWVKRGTLGTSQSIFYATPDGSTVAWNGTNLWFDTSNQLRLQQANSPSTYYVTSAVFRDPSAWYHIVVAVDTTQATSANRAIIYVNGVSQTLTIPLGSGYAQNDNTWVNGTYEHDIGSQNDSPRALYLDGYLAEVNFVDGQQLAATAFGQYDQFSNWTSKQYTGTYGTNGFYLPFKNNSSTGTLGLDFSGNNNTWTTNNFSVTAGTTYDSMTDVPTQWIPYNVSGDVGGVFRGNYCTMNPVFAPIGGANYYTLSNANLTITGTSSANSGGSIGTMSSTTGKLYYEFTMTGVDASGYCIVGACDVDQLATLTSYNYLGYGSKSYGYNSTGVKTNNNGNSAYGSSFTTGDVISVAVDCTNGAIYFAKNGVWQASGDPTSGATKTGAAYTWTAGSQNMIPQMDVYRTGSIMGANFGQYAFSYAPPSGYKSLCTTNLPTPTIQQGNLVMDVTLYTGTSATQVITNTAGFKPDFAWFKSRNAANHNILIDSVRGVDKDLYSSLTQAEDTITDRLLSFNSNGVTVGVDTGRGVNYAGQTQVLWQWQAGQGTNTTNTSGSITSTVSVNATAGFSVVTYTGNGTSGATIGHGLGVAPSMVIVKSRSAAGGWPVYQTTYGATQYLNLQTTDATASSSGLWNNTAPTSSVFSVGNDSWVNTNTRTYVAYCWAEVAGFSKFGSYTGNGSTDGPFIYTGFRPKFVMIKQSSASGENWTMYDSARNTYNSTNSVLFADTSSAEFTSNSYVPIDLVSNGFKIRTDGAGRNASGATYIYMAFAEYPFKSALAR